MGELVWWVCLQPFARCEVLQIFGPTLVASSWAGEVYTCTEKIMRYGNEDISTELRILEK